MSDNPKTENIEEPVVSSGKLDHYVQKNLLYLKKKKKINNISYQIFNILIAILNLSTIVMASIILHNLINKKNSNDIFLIFALLVALLTIVSFFMTFIIMVYRGLNRKERFISAREKIEFLVLQYKFKTGTYEKANDDEKLLIQDIEDVIKGIDKKRKKINFFRLIILSLIGGDSY
jgi:ABC-type multidrug transport system fused ATPase/permease subunit